MRILIMIGTLLLIAGCASNATPVDIPVDIALAGDAGEVNTAISSSIQNIVNQMDWTTLATIGVLAWFVGWLSPGPLEIISGFFTGVKQVISGVRSLYK